jgi:fatty-acyl-CoA synthase
MVSGISSRSLPAVARGSGILADGRLSKFSGYRPLTGVPAETYDQPTLSVKRTSVRLTHRQDVQRSRMGTTATASPGSTPETVTAAAPAVTIGALLDHAALSWPDRVAVVGSDATLTYGELAASVRRLSAALHHAGVRRGDRIGLWLPNSAFWLQAHAALARLGAVAVGINFRYPVREVTRIAAAAGIAALVIDPAADGAAGAAALSELAAVPDLEVRAVLSASGPVPVPEGWTCWDGSDFLTFAGNVPAEADPAAPCTVFPSSGSTGSPKLIAHSQAGIAAHSAAVARAFGYDREDAVVLGQLPLCGVWGFNTVYGAIAGGATAVLMQRFDAARTVDLIERYRVTSANGPDLFLRQLFGAAGQARGRAASLRSVGFSTFSNDGVELVQWGRRLGVTVFQVYGSSEQLALMVRRPDTASVEERADAGGIPSNPETKLRIRDAVTGMLAEPGEAGVLESRGPNTMLGYLTPDGVDSSALTDDGWVRSGDICVLDDSGLRYLSREKDALRLSGFLVDPREIELRIEELDGVEEAQVVGIDTERGPRCVAFVRAADAASFDPGRLLDQCKESLASYKVPARIFPVEDFPRIDGANGPRIQRKALREMAMERMAK